MFWELQKRKLSKNAYDFAFTKQNIQIVLKKGINMGTLAEDKRKALKQAQKENNKPIKTQKSEEIPIDTVIDVSCL